METVHHCKPSELMREIEQIPPQYLPQLFQIVHSYRESITKKESLVDFEQSWLQAVSGDTTPVSELWEDIDAA